MKFLPLRDFDVVTSALNFDTPDCHVTGGCDLYTTKAAGSDKKLYKNIDRSLESQHEAMLKFGASLSPPQRSSLNLSRSSPFGPLSDVSSRKTFAYLIATLNASHPDYDFSHVLRPADFKRERPLRRVMTNLNETLRSARPNAQPTVDFPVSALLLSSAATKKSKKAAKAAAAAAAAAASSGIGCSPPAVYGTESPPWGPHMWALLDKEMTLKDCAVFSYQPALNPFEEEAAAIWSLHYFFFNKERKRVSYLYVRGVPVVSHNSSPPPSFLRASQGFTSSLSAMMAARRRSSAMSMTPTGPAREPSSSGTAASASTAIAEGSDARNQHKRSIGVAEEDDDADDGDDNMVATSFGSEGANKRARFWLGDRATSLSTMMSEDEEDEFYADDGLIWNRDRDGTLELDEFAGSYDDAEDDGYTYGGVGVGGGVAGWGDVFSEEEDEDGGDEAEVRTIRHSPGARRDTSEEDIAGRMEIE